MLVALIPFFPLVAFLVLLIFGSAMPRRFIAIAGFVGILLSCVICLKLASEFSGPVSFVAWTWIGADSGFFEPIQFGFHLDSLSLLMTTMVTFIATLIAIFSIQFLDEESDLNRFFASMNLFVSSMLVLVLADNLLLLLLGWEGVGLCSYLLIGFWYEDKENGSAAIKAFLTTRIGDVGLLIAILIAASSLGSLVISDLPALARSTWDSTSVMPTVLCLSLLFAATGKSAQLPLHNWLPDAMRGPTPVSALIHAATMVTAGVYLIARLNGLFALSLTAQAVVLIVGAATLLLAGVSALFQNDIKRVLAYSTMSQIGYMFLALGAGAYSAAIFHLLTHAFFKALLFLSAGVIGYSAHHEYNMFRLGGLRKTLPIAYYSFLIGGLCLSALPLVTSGFYSKEFILSNVLFSMTGGQFAWLSGIVGAFLTGLYTFRAILITFHGEEKTGINHRPGILMALPLVVLSLFSLFIGFLETPESIFHVKVFDHWLAGLFTPMKMEHHAFLTESTALVLASVVSICGILAGILLYRNAIPQNNLITKGFGFDDLYSTLFIQPFKWTSKILKTDLFGKMAQAIADGFLTLSYVFTRSQTGRVSDYAGFFAFCISLILIAAVLVLR